MMMMPKESDEQPLNNSSAIGAAPSSTMELEMEAEDDEEEEEEPVEEDEMEEEEVEHEMEELPKSSSSTGRRQSARRRAAALAASGNNTAATSRNGGRGRATAKATVKQEEIDVGMLQVQTLASRGLRGVPGGGEDENVAVDGADGGIIGGNWTLDESTKRVLIDLQRHWLADYQVSREKTMVDLIEKLHQEFLADKAKTRAQFKDELEATRRDIEAKYAESQQAELQRATERHRRELSQAKKKQWCFQCEQEAIYHCCWNTAYCSVECQQAHWPNHRRACRRKKAQQAAAQSQQANGAASDVNADQQPMKPGSSHRTSH